jgi:hypothetical protein
MEAANRLREEEEDLINLLRQEEAEAKRMADEQEQRRKAEQMRREIQLANEYQMKLKVCSTCGCVAMGHVCAMSWVPLSVIKVSV